MASDGPERVAAMAYSVDKLVSAVRLNNWSPGSVAELLSEASGAAMADYVAVLRQLVETTLVKHFPLIDLEKVFAAAEHSTFMTPSGRGGEEYATCAASVGSSTAHVCEFSRRQNDVCAVLSVPDPLLSVKASRAPGKCVYWCTGQMLEAIRDRIAMDVYAGVAHKRLADGDAAPKRIWVERRVLLPILLSYNRAFKLLLNLDAHVAVYDFRPRCV